MTEFGSESHRWPPGRTGPRPLNVCVAHDSCDMVVHGATQNDACHPVGSAESGFQHLMQACPVLSDIPFATSGLLVRPDNTF